MGFLIRCGKIQQLLTVAGSEGFVKQLSVIGLRSFDFRRQMRAIEKEDPALGSSATELRQHVGVLLMRISGTLMDAPSFSLQTVAR